MVTFEIRLSLLASIIVLCPGLAFAEPRLMTRSRILMGTSFEITVEAEPAMAEQGFDLFFREIERLEGLLSHYDPASDLRSLMKLKDRKKYESAEDLYKVLQEAHTISSWSQGYFDITVGVWTPPNGVFDQRKTNDPRIGWELVELLSHNRVRLGAKDMQLDLGGLAKGYALDRGRDKLLELGIDRFLLSSGGSTYLAGLPPRGESGWPVLIPSVVKEGYGRLVRLVGRALSVSECPSKPEGCGIFDPVNGVMVAGPRAAAVLASKAVMADGLSTALIVCPQEINNKVLENAGTSSAWVTKNNKESFLGSNAKLDFQRAFNAYGLPTFAAR